MIHLFTMSVRICIGNLVFSYLNWSDVLKAVRIMFDKATKQLIPVCTVPIHLLYNSCHLDVSDLRKKAASSLYNLLDQIAVGGLYRLPRRVSIDLLHN
jgi:hypothetical protein